LKTKPRPRCGLQSESICSSFRYLAPIVRH